MFDRALFDDDRYGFDVDGPVVETIPLPSQQWKRDPTSPWIRRP